MKITPDTSAEELAGLVCQTLREAGITVTLTGGACVAIWSSGKYVSSDLDFIAEGPVPGRQVEAALETLGFKLEGNEFVHPRNQFYVEFPAPPLMVGKERVNKVTERDTPAGTLRLLSPTDCVKDRLAAYFHWNDRQALEQALLVAIDQRINLADIRRWSRGEDNQEKFDHFSAELRKRKRKTKRR